MLCNEKEYFNILMLVPKCI